MKTTYITFILLLTYLLASCSEGSAELNKVSYHFSMNSDRKCEVFIAYKDSTGYVTLYTDRDWSQSVYLRSGELASLMVIIRKDYDMSNEFQNFILWDDIPQSDLVINEAKIVANDGDNSLSVYYQAPDIGNYFMP